jgi:pyruvate dehydrogenase (quinone)
MTGDIKFNASQNLPDFPYARFAEECGLRGIRVDNPDDIGRAWEQAISSDRPVVLEAITDPDVPTLPPHITLKQAKNFASSLLKGDPEERGIITQAVKGMMDTLNPHDKQSDDRGT